ncbi:MAG TPA: nicotinate-nucleotide adenylyltransferase [Flavisolibacter sp.]
MKRSSTFFLLCAIAVGFTFPALGQEILPEVTVKAVKYKYLNAVDQKDVAQPVKLLERRAAEYDVKSSEFYEEDYDTYFVSFYLPEGQVLAAYDKDGKLLHTAEKYKDVALPVAVRDAVAKRFPQWSITKDVYLVNYFEESGASKTYKITLQNGDKRLKVKTNEKGEFL